MRKETPFLSDPRRLKKKDHSKVAMAEKKKKFSPRAPDLLETKEWTDVK